MEESTVNIKDIAKQTDVSIATVSRIINNRPDVSDRLRRKVQKVLAQHNYKPRVISNRRTNLAIVMEMENPLIEDFWAGVLSGISIYAFEQGIGTSIMFFPSIWAQKEDIAKLIRERRCNAAVLVSAFRICRQADVLANSGVPIILIAGQSEIPEIGFMDSASIKGAVNATEHLISLGHKKIAFLAGSLDLNTDHRNRLAGYKKAMRKAGIKIRPDWVVPHVPLTPTPAAGQEQTKRLLQADPSVTAIIATNDSMAYGAILACNELGRKVPEDISIVGFDDYHNSAFMNPPLTTVRQPISQLGYEAAKAADTLARDIIDIPPRKIFPCELIVRKSTAVCRELLKSSC